MKYGDAINYLERGGDLAVPCSRYGSSTFDCAPVALFAAWIVADETGEPLTFDGLDYLMGLVVNDSDSVETLIADHAPGCRWFAQCEHRATRMEPHPVLELVPTCDRCGAFIAASA